MSVIKNQLFEKEMDDYIDPPSAADFDYPNPREEEDYILAQNERKYDEQWEAERYENKFDEEFPMIYNNENHRPGRNPTFSGCVSYFLLQGLIILIIFLITKS